MRLFGQFQTVSRRHRRGEFGVLQVCIANVICEGTLIEPYIEVARSHDMWRLGRIRRDTWLQWEADTVEGTPRNMMVLEGAQPALEAIADEVQFGGEGDNVVDMFLKGYKPPEGSLIHVEHNQTDAIPDCFMRKVE